MPLTFDVVEKVAVVVVGVMNDGLRWQQGVPPVSVVMLLLLLLFFW